MFKILNGVRQSRRYLIFIVAMIGCLLVLANVSHILSRAGTDGYFIENAEF